MFKIFYADGNRLPSFYNKFKAKMEGKRNAKASFPWNRGRGKKRAWGCFKCPTVAFGHALSPDGEKSADDYNKWKAELMEKKRKAQEEAAKKPKQFLGLF